MKTNFIILLFSGLLIGCDPPATPPASDNKLFEAQRDALEKSEEVQKLINDRAEQQKQIIDQQTK